ncbi:MAG: 50S ribosomal protein L10 [bacterium]|nr:50S ribosomal protein L10 [bacterium]
MPKTKDQKEQILKSLKDKLAISKSVVFSSDKGLDVKTIERLRNELKGNGAEYMVAKKTLLKLATKELGESDDLENLDGSVALTFSYEDEVAGARILNKYAKENENLKLGGGILENKVILAEMVNRLAQLPTRAVLLAKLVGSLNSPISGMVGVLSGNLRNLVGVLNAIKEKKV